LSELLKKLNENFGNPFRVGIPFRRSTSWKESVIAMFLFFFFPGIAFSIVGYIIYDIFREIFNFTLGVSFSQMVGKQYRPNAMTLTIFWPWSLLVATRIARAPVSPKSRWIRLLIFCALTFMFTYFLVLLVSPKSLKPF